MIIVKNRGNRINIAHRAKTYKINVGGRRGLQGPIGPQGPEGPAGGSLVTSVNGKQGAVVLDAEDVGAVDSVTAGTNITITGTPTNPIINADGGGDVESVNGQTGVVVLDQDDVLDGVTYKQYSQTDKTKVGHITVNQAVNLDTMESDIANKQPLDSDLTAIAALTPTDNDVIQRKAGAWTNRTPVQLKTDLALTKSDVGLANVDNTSDANKPVSTAQQTALNLKANLASPALTGNPTAPTQAANNNSTRIATTAYADAKVQDAITDAVTTIAPSQNAVFDALALKANDNAVVKLTGNQTVAGIKTFSSVIRPAAGVASTDAVIMSQLDAVAYYMYLGMVAVPLQSYLTNLTNGITDNGRRLDDVEDEAGPHNWLVAAPTTVVTKAERDAEDLPYWPDSVMSFTQIGSDIIGMATDSRWVVGQGGDPFLGAVSFSYADRPQIDNILDPTGVTYGGGGPVWKDGSNLFMIWHGEKNIVGGAIPDAFWSFLGMAKSTDGGLTWNDMGRIVEPDMSFNILANNEIGAGAYVIDGGYMYVYFKETIGDDYWTARQLNMSVARCSTADILAAFAGNTTPVFKKYNNGTWTENGIGGVASDLFHGSALPRAWDIVYLEDREQFMIAYSHVDELAYGGNWFISCRLGDTPTSFGAPERLLGPSTAETLYVTLSSPDQSSQKSVAGEVVDLYFTEHEDQTIPRWEDATLQKTSLTFSPAGDTMEPIKLEDANLSNGWGVVIDPDEPATVQTLDYYQHKGRAYLHSDTGLMGGNPGDTIFTLPEEYRPREKFDIKITTINPLDGTLFPGSIVIPENGNVTSFFNPSFSYIPVDVSWAVTDLSQQAGGSVSAAQVVDIATDIIDVSLATKVDQTQIDTDATLAANSDTRVPSQKAIKTYTDGGFAYIGGAMTSSITAERSATRTLTNARITPRIGTVTSSGTPTINTDNVDQFNITALAANITSMTTNLSGTPTDGQKLMIRIKDNSSPRTIAWGASFVSSGIAALLTTTVASQTHLIGFIYDSVTSKWVCTAVDSTGY